MSLQAEFTPTVFPFFSLKPGAKTLPFASTSGRGRADKQPSEIHTILKFDLIWSPQSLSFSFFFPLCQRVKRAHLNSKSHSLCFCCCSLRKQLKCFSGHSPPPPPLGWTSIFAVCRRRKHLVAHKFQKQRQVTNIHKFQTIQNKKIWHFLVSISIGTDTPVIYRSSYIHTEEVL